MFSMKAGDFLAMMCLMGSLCLLGCGGQSAHSQHGKTSFPDSLQFLSRQQISHDNDWQEIEKLTSWRPAETAIIICDMWDRHWCDSATARVAAMAPKVNYAIEVARKRGVKIIHAPSSTMEFYQDHPARNKAIHLPRHEPPIPLAYWFHLDSTREDALPIDDSDEGCDSAGDKPESVWTRQIETIDIYDEDLISDSGQEIFNYCEEEGIVNIALCGVHTNMCVLGRTFGIRGQVKVGKNVVLLRDLTDAMYNPAMPPYVSHVQGVDLVINHIEKYWAPSTSSDDFID